MFSIYEFYELLLIKGAKETSNLSIWLEKNGEKVLRSIGIEKGQDVLDFGCGSGNYTIPAAKIVEETGKVYARYSGSPTGSLYDMAPFTNNFGRTRLKMRTPIKGLYHPKFVVGVFGAVLGGMQAIDMILERKVMNGNARFKPKQK